MIHYIKLCECGIVLAQCRCIGDKAIETVKPCLHQESIVSTGELPKCKECKRTFINSGDYCMPCAEERETKITFELIGEYLHYCQNPPKVKDGPQPISTSSSLEGFYWWLDKRLHDK